MGIKKAFDFYRKVSKLENKVHDQVPKYASQATNPLMHIVVTSYAPNTCCGIFARAQLSKHKVF